MELHQLKYFVALARTGNFTRAAEACFVSQPSLSQQIKKLEDELGEELVHRSRQQTTLTSGGQIFLRRATTILRELEGIKGDLEQNQSGQVRGVVHVGIVPTVAPYLIPPTLRAFASEFPAVHGHVIEEPSTRLREMLAAGEIDLAIVSLPIDGQGLAIEPLADEELLLGLPKNHPLAGAERIQLSHLRMERFVMLKAELAIARRMMEACVQAGFQPNVAFRTSQLVTIERLVAAGMGISLFPALAVRPAPGIVFRRLEAPAPFRSLAVVRHRSFPQSKAAKGFLSQLRKTIQGPLASDLVRPIGSLM